MKRFLSLILAYFLMLGSFTVTAYAQEETLSIFVQTGATGGNGTINAPFGSVEEARDHIRLLKENNSYPQKGVTVYLRGGNYNIKAGIQFDERDSGTPDGPITYRAYKDEIVTFSAGASLNLNQFKKVTDKNVLARIPAVAQGQVLQINLLEQGLTLEDLGKMYPMGAQASTVSFINNFGTPHPNAELFLNNQNMTLARWPNDDYTRVSETVEGGTALGTEKYEGVIQGAIFKAAGERLNNWITAPDAWVHGYWQYDWLDSAAKVVSIDPKDGTIETLQPLMPQAGKRFYIYNLLEELDIKGEWYLERETGILYFYPPKKSGTVSLSLLLDDLFKLTNVEYVNFKALTMTAARGNFFTITNCKNINIENCELSYTAASAVVISGSSYNCSVKTCHIYGIGKNAIGLGGGDKETLTAGNNVVENCWIHNFSRLMKNSAPAVTLSGVGNRVAHNRINDAPQWAIRLTGNDHVIEYNEIYDVLKESADAGVIYAWCSLVDYGNVIRNNYIHDCSTDSEQTHGIMCFYFDCLFSGVTVENNIIENFPGSVLAINGGRDVTFRNNIMINCNSFNSVSATGMYGIYNTEQTTISSKVAQLGISDENPVYSKPAYAKYPTLPGLMDDIKSTPSETQDSGGIPPKRNVLENNVAVNVKKSEIGLAYAFGLTRDYLWSINTYEDPWATASDPGFTDYEGRKYTLKADSEIYKQYPDFVAPDFENIGIYTPQLYGKLGDAVSMRIGSPVAHKGLTYDLIDEDNTEVTPVIVNDKTMVPVRFMAEILGGTADWDNEKQTATINVENNTLVIDGANGTITLNGAKIEGDSPINLNGRFLVPLRVISEAMNKKVDWYEQGMIIISDRENILDKEKDTRMIDELYRRLSFR